MVPRAAHANFAAAASAPRHGLGRPDGMPPLRVRRHPTPSLSVRLKCRPGTSVDTQEEAQGDRTNDVGSSMRPQLSHRSRPRGSRHRT
eukprot:scaffold31563_cov27-Tisochrysis_lutea.AAC.7